jgi:hypothetical protein
VLDAGLRLAGASLMHGDYQRHGGCGAGAMIGVRRSCFEVNVGGDRGWAYFEPGGTMPFMRRYSTICP